MSWFKSSYSDDQGGDCLEVAYACREPGCGRDSVRVRDSKLGSRSPQLRLPADAWARFVAYTRS
ncbi:DUF397 domain-containing protein [Streptomyces silvensis]|uniref:DUF397 domain-containing protein n=1 Tax=Streptomyces silvensis TaxID=1765722 RepID=UPI00321FF94D